MKSTIICISIIIVLLIIMGGLLYLQFTNSNQINKLLIVKKQLDASADAREKVIQELKDRPPIIVTKDRYITEKEYINLSEEQKKKLLFDFQTDHDNMQETIVKQANTIDNDTTLIDGYRKLTNDYVDKLNKVFIPKWGMFVLESGTFDSGYSLNATTNLDFVKYFNFKKFNFYIGGGASFNMNNNIRITNINYGGGINIVFGFTF